MNRDRKTDPFLCILWKVFQVLTRKQGEEIPSGPLYCPTSSALRCISNLVRNTNQEVISARGATCHTQPCIGQYKGLLWWTINRPAPSQIRFSSHKWPILCLESRHLIHFCRVFTIAKVDHFGTEFSSFRAKAKILKQNQISSNFLIVCTFFNRICGELIE